MRWLQLIGLQERLLPTSDASTGVELVESSLEDLPNYSGAPRVNVVESRCRDYMISVLLLVAFVFPSIMVVVVISTQWQSNPSQRGWLILGFGFYIVAGLRHCWSLLMKLGEQILYLRVEVRHIAASTLFEAITEAVASEADQTGRTCSFDLEAVQEHDTLTGMISVKFRFWSSQARTIHIEIKTISEEQLSRQHLKVQVDFLPGEDVVMGRDSRLERRELLVLWVRTSPAQVLVDKHLLKQWLEGSYANFVKPAKGFVNVYALQESSTDWIPEWKFERVKQLKSTRFTGQGFFLERRSLSKILKDAKIWRPSELRVYMISGPPGVGKSEFTIWLAGQLGLPVYRLSLSSRQLTDERLAQLLSQSSVAFNSVLVQIDEFQDTLKRWDAGETTVGVTPSGFCEVLQGSTAMSRGVVILTGTQDIVAGTLKNKFPAVYRRIHRTGELSWMSEYDICCYFRKFIERFVTGLTDADWAHRKSQFMDGSCWSTQKNISIDMLKQFLMQQITESHCENFGGFLDDRAGFDARAFQVTPEHLDSFFDLVCHKDTAADFLRMYAPVHAESHSGAHELESRRLVAGESIVGSATYIGS